MSGIFGAGLFDKLRILYGSAAQNQALHTQLQKLFYCLQIANTAAKLDRNFYSFKNAFNHRQVFALARQRTVKINKMQPFGTAGRPLGSHLRRVIGKNSFCIKASLRQTHAASATDIYCRIYNHNFPLIIQQNFSAGACRLCSTFPDGTERPEHYRVPRKQ